jgi:hypothetical protein
MVSNLSHHAVSADRHPWTPRWTWPSSTAARRRAFCSALPEQLNAESTLGTEAADPLIRSGWAGQAQGAVVGAATGLFVSAVSTACFQLGLYEGAAVQAEAGSTQAHGEQGTHQQDLFEA